MSVHTGQDMVAHIGTKGDMCGAQHLGQSTFRRGITQLEATIEASSTQQSEAIARIQNELADVRRQMKDGALPKWWVLGLRLTFVNAGPLACVAYQLTVEEQGTRLKRGSSSAAKYWAALAPKLASVTEDGSEGDRPAAAALSRLATWQQAGVVLFSRTSMSAVYFAPQLTMDPVRWWQQHGHFAPELQTVAQRVLCIPATATANERVFSAFSHVWSDKRASLILGRMWVMAYIYEWEEYERWMRKTPQVQDHDQD
ncbi:hypothetical protein QJQ45_004422 [Haematococcus lacustris]|nr:hypothetical protein QJQ45_004422 [Haematococcus lacustris]